MGLYKYKHYCGNCNSEFEPRGGIGGGDLCIDCYGKYRERIEAVLDVAAGSGVEQDIQSRLPQARTVQVCHGCGTEVSANEGYCSSCARSEREKCEEEQRAE